MSTLLEDIQTLHERMKRDLATKEDVAALGARIDHILSCVVTVILLVAALLVAVAFLTARAML